MAKTDEDEKPAAAAAREAAKAADPPEDAETFDHEWLISAGPGLGFKPEEVAGALSGVSKKNLTIDEAKAAVKAWLKAPVKTETEA